MAWFVMVLHRIVEPAFAGLNRDDGGLWLNATVPPVHDEGAGAERAAASVGLMLTG